ncbi:MAG: c-type cytochrome domain-containing protein [Pseudomonadales bacterium]
MSDCRQRARRETSSIILGWAFVLPAFGLTGANEYASAVEQSADTTTTIESASAAPPAFDALKSMMNQFCYKCHGGGTTEADVDLTAYTRRETLLANIDATREIRDAVARHEMPPEDEKQPTRNQRAQMVAAFDAVIDDHLKQHRSWAAVVMGRLNRYEYNNAVARKKSKGGRRLCLWNIMLGWGRKNASRRLLFD